MATSIYHVRSGSTSFKTTWEKYKTRSRDAKIDTCRNTIISQKFARTEHFTSECLLAIRHLENLHILLAHHIFSPVVFFAIPEQSSIHDICFTVFSHPGQFLSISVQNIPHQYIQSWSSSYIYAILLIKGTEKIYELQIRNYDVINDV